MLFSDVLTDVYRILKDPGRIAFSKVAVAKGISAAVRRVLNATNTACGQATLSMVSGTRKYDLPDGIRRITRVRLVPLAGGEPVDLTQYYPNELPYTSPRTDDPIAFSILTGIATIPTTPVTGVNYESKLSFLLFPTPTRSAADAIVVDYEVNYTFTSSTSDSERIYVSETLTDVVAWLAASDALLESWDDASDIQKAGILKSQAERRLADNFFTESLSLRVDKNRAFP